LPSPKKLLPIAAARRGRGCASASRRNHQPAVTPRANGAQHMPRRPHPLVCKRLSIETRPQHRYGMHAHLRNRKQPNRAKICGNALNAIRLPSTRLMRVHAYLCAFPIQMHVPSSENPHTIFIQGAVPGRSCNIAFLSKATIDGGI
jgi:hypothetical protein